MKVDITDVQELKDGGAYYTLDLDNETLNLLAGIGLKTALQEMMLKVKEENEEAEEELKE